MTTTSNFLKQDSLILFLAIAPILYLCWVWPILPDMIPLHWNFQGEVDRLGSKSTLLITSICINLFSYLLMLALPHIAPRKQELQAMGSKYTRVRVVLQLFIAALSFAIILLSKDPDYWPKNYLLGSCFILFMVLFGNYVGSVRPNYFVGIRTPWTLQSDTVWRKTHHLASRLLMLGAVLSILSLLVFPESWGMLSIMILFMAALLGPAVYSFFLYQREGKTT